MITIRVNPEEKLLTIRYEGEVRFDDWETFVLKTLKERPELIEYDSITDSRMPHTVLSLGEMVQFGKLVQRSGLQSKRRRSVTLAEQPALYGNSRMFEMLTESERLVTRCTVRTVAEMAAFLGRSPELIQAELDAAADMAKTTTAAKTIPCLG